MNIARVARHWKQPMSEVDRLTLDEYNWLVREMNKEIQKAKKKK